ncbi:putative transposase [Methylobacterium pseudosasicola]|uniref:Putative transposase n=1 Tax=Methylobacterium pseudosasicola TaxID=582667 RepID=A0A1I4RM98_9HYPH|nr:putative transposase [Methylobacterium pseudosasicola]
MAWSATTTGISAERVCDLMIACCEHRFGATKAPHAVEWLSENASAYIVKETAQTAAALELRCFSPRCARRRATGSRRRL